MLTGALTCAFVFPPECERPRICIQLPPNAPPAVSRGYHERGPGLRGTSSGTTSLAVVSSSPQGHVTTTSTPELGAAADDRGSGRSVVTVAFLPVARVGVVNASKAVVDHDAQGSEQGQPGDQHPSTETESRQLAVLDGAGHCAHVYAEDGSSLGDSHDGRSAYPQLLEVHVTPYASATRSP